jgi:uncharacterized protein (TIGR02757 family)
MDNKAEIDWEELKSFLDERVDLYNRPNFIEADPIAIPHRYTMKEDIEIAAFLAATIAWGNRKIIVKNAHRLLDLFGESPYDFVMESKKKQQQPLSNFVHRTFQGADLLYFVKALRHIYATHGGIEGLFVKHAQPHSMQYAITQFRRAFFEIPHPERSTKHVSDPSNQSSAKRLNMFLRWLVRTDKRGVDFGIWKQLHPSQLSIPLDVHSGNTARKLGLLQRKQNDAKAVEELDGMLRKLDKEDPVKYDFALFGLGIFEKF